MPPRNQDRDGTATKQAERATGTAAKERISKATPDLSAVVRQELAAAATELKKEFLKAGRGYRMLGAAGFAGYMALLFASIAVWAALATVLASGTAAIIVAFIWAVTGAVLYVLSRRERDPRTKPRRTAAKATKRTRGQKGPGDLKGAAANLAGNVKRAFRR
jgi:Flp pilus assembly protein TadB